MQLKKVFDESSSLFFDKEIKVVFGKKRANWWILFFMFLVALCSIAYSDAALSYLYQKMNDPFINWVNIQNRIEAPIKTLVDSLSNQEQLNAVKEKYDIKNIERNVYWREEFVSLESKGVRFDGRSIDLQSDVLKKVLGDENKEKESIKEFQDMKKSSLGLIVTKEMLLKLGYSKAPYPLYIKLAYPNDTSKVNVTSLKKLGLQYSYDWVVTTLPVLAVVKRLPDNMDFLCSSSLEFQRNNNGQKAVLDPTNYTNDVVFVIDDINYEKYKTEIETFVSKKFPNVTYRTDNDNDIFTEAKKMTFSNSIDSEWIQIFTKSFEQEFNSKGVYRTFLFETIDVKEKPADYISIQFNSLDYIRKFVDWAERECGVKIEITQIEAKENFAIVSQMGLILSGVIIILSIAFIIMFLNNLFKNYFEKIKKNIGTFKAFGLSDKILIRIYVLVFSRLVLTSMFFAYLGVISTDYIFRLCHLHYEKNEDYLLLNSINWYLIGTMIFILIGTMITIYISTKKLLKSTPGDLIYERD